MSKFKKGDKVLIFRGLDAEDELRTVYSRVSYLINKEVYSIKELLFYVYCYQMTKATLDNPVNRLLYPDYKVYKQFLVEELPNEKENQ